MEEVGGWVFYFKRTEIVTILLTLFLFSLLQRMVLKLEAKQILR